MDTTSSHSLAFVIAFASALAAPTLSCAQENTPDASIAAKTTPKKTDTPAAAPESSTLAQDPDWAVRAAPGPAMPLAAAEALEDGRWHDAFAALEASPPDPEVAPHIAFAHGWAAHRAGKHQRAVEIMEAVASASELLSSDASSVVAESAFALGDDTRAVSAAYRAPTASNALTWCSKAMASGPATSW